MYRNMTNALNPDERGDFKISHFTIGENNLMAKLQGIDPGEYVKLTHKGQVMMSNTDMEKQTNYHFCVKAHGDVLIGGLGIGMIVMAIQDNVNVKSITIIEKHQEIIDMITEQLPFNEKVNIICADVFEWKPEKGQKFDCIYMDIWNYINSDVYQKEMKPLKRKYGHYLKPKEISPRRFNRCWAEYQAKNNMRL